MATKYTKWSYNISKFSISKGYQNVKKLDGLFENKPSGNPDYEALLVPISKCRMIQHF
jgi:hypothetical protein